MELHAVLKFLYVRAVFGSVPYTGKRHLYLCLEPGAREKSENEIKRPDVVKQARLPFIRFVNLCKQVNNMVCFAEIVQDVVVLSMNAKLFKRFFEGPGLLKKAEDFVDLNWKSPQISNSNCPSI